MALVAGGSGSSLYIYRVYLLTYLLMQSSACRAVLFPAYFPIGTPRCT